jgi:hypothetical protein
MWCSTLAFSAISRPLACASAFVSAEFDARWLPSTSLNHRAVSAPPRAPQRLGAGEAGAQTAALGVD